MVNDTNFNKYILYFVISNDLNGCHVQNINLGEVNMKIVLAGIFLSLT